MNNQNQPDDNLVLPQPQANNLMFSEDNSINNQPVDDSKLPVINPISNGEALETGTSNNDTVSTVNQAPVAIADSDLIEKEWVNKIKAIVESTRGNPFLQSKEINDLKAEYVYAKYNKIIKAE